MTRRGLVRLLAAALGAAAVVRVRRPAPPPAARPGDIPRRPLPRGPLGEGRGLAG